MYTYLYVTTTSAVAAASSAAAAHDTINDTNHTK